MREKNNKKIFRNYHFSSITTIGDTNYHMTLTINIFLNYLSSISIFQIFELLHFSHKQ